MLTAGERENARAMSFGPDTWRSRRSRLVAKAISTAFAKERTTERRIQEVGDETLRLAQMRAVDAEAGELPAEQAA